MTISINEDFIILFSIIKPLISNIRVLLAGTILFLTSSSYQILPLPVVAVWADTIHCPIPPTLCEGTEGDDIIAGFDILNDNINARGGNDIIRGGTGDDQIIAGTGNDTVWAEDGDDFVDGGPGNDLIDGYFGNDHLEGDAGKDDISGYVGIDSIAGGLGSDRLFGGTNQDRISGSFWFGFIRDFHEIL